MTGEMFGMPIISDSRCPKCPKCGYECWILPIEGAPICGFCNEEAIGKTREEIEIVRSLGDLRK